LTLFGVAAVVVLVEEIESVSCKTPAAAVDPALTATTTALEPLVVIGAVPLTLVTPPDAPCGPAALTLTVCVTGVSVTL
jgi:hypothetical protein